MDIPEKQNGKSAVGDRDGEAAIRSMRNWRVILLYCLFLAIMVILFIRIYNLTVLQGAEYMDRSENNFVSENVLTAPRGRIVDRHGNLIALNRISFDVSMSPYKLSRDQIRTTVDRVSQLVQRPQISDKKEILLKKRRVWERVTLAENLELDAVIPLLERAAQLPGVMVTRNYARSYPAGIKQGHITGFVGGMNSVEIEHFGVLGYRRNEPVGRIGAEKSFEPLLHGDHGEEIIIRDRLGQPKQRYPVKPAEPGHVIHLTLDNRLQQLAYDLLEGWLGAIVMLNPKNGEILVMVSRPSYDPNQPADMESGQSQLNRVTNARSAPGSLFKIVTAAAALDAGFRPDENISCQREFFLKDVTTPYRCHSRWGHGHIDMYRALEVSCNIYFYTWANRLKARPLYNMASRFGFGQTSGVEIHSGNREIPGVLINPEEEVIYPGEVLLMGIGQGKAIEVTPIQVARAYAALCNGGRLIRPHLLKEVREARGELVSRPVFDMTGELPLTDEARHQIIEGLKAVVSGENGTGRHAMFKKSWKVAGKTSTAQLSRKKGDANAWFAGFAPYDDPRVVVVALVVKGGSGGKMAAPLARQMLAAWFGEPEDKIKPPSLEALDEIEEAVESPDEDGEPMANEIETEEIGL
jgi:penicillin-binding protein 2